MIDDKLAITLTLPEWAALAVWIAGEKLTAKGRDVLEQARLKFNAQLRVAILGEDDMAAPTKEVH